MITDAAPVAERTLQEGAVRPAVGSRRSWMRFLVGFVLLCGVLLGAGAVDATGRRGLAILAAVLVTAVAVERVLHGSTVEHAMRSLGRPDGRAMVLAAAVSALVLLVFPLTAALRGATVVLRPDWAWLLIGILAFRGLAFKLVLIPAVALPTFSVLIIAVALTVPLLVLVVPRRLFTAAPPVARPREEQS